MSAIPSPPESRVVLHDVRWDTYEALLADRGDHGPRLAYDRGTLEIMSPSRKHEKLKKLLGRLVEAFSEELNIKISSGGSTTLRSQFKERGLEPDESYYVQNEAMVRDKEEIDLTVDPPPDLAIEVDIRSSSLDKLGIYASLKVPEVWSHDGKRLAVHQFQKAGNYAVLEHSSVLPMLPLADLNRFLEQRNALDETSLLRAFRAWVRCKFATS